MSCFLSNKSCLNGGQCVANSCACSTCFIGNECEKRFNLLELPMTSAMLHDTPTSRAVYVFIFILLAIIGLFNNSLALATFVRERIRITASGVYLIIFCSFNLVLMILLMSNVLTVLDYRAELYMRWSCYALAYICLTLDYIFIWMSVALIIEKVLIECFNFDLISSRTRPVFITIGIILFVGLSNLAEIFGRGFVEDTFNRRVCSYDTTNHAGWFTMHYILSYFHVIIPCFAHLICISCILTTIVRRKIFISHHQNPTQRLYQVWLRQLYCHGDFLIPPLTIIICILPHAIVHYLFLVKCMPSPALGPLRLHIALVLLLNFPQIFAFFIYVYPSEFYTNEFRQTYVYRILCYYRYKRRREEDLYRRRTSSAATLNPVTGSEL